MGRFHLCLLTTAVLVALLTSPQTARAQSANGKELYRNNCKVCHDKGSPHGQYSPMTLTQDQWNHRSRCRIGPLVSYE